MHAGRLPMYSPVWTNDKTWAQKMANKFSSSLEEIPNLAAQYLPFFNRRSARSFVTGRPSMTSTPQSSNFVFVLLCGLWYTTSALSSNTGKAILNQFRYPITLTFVQFGFVAFYCLLFMSPLVRFSKLRMPTRAIISSTFPMGLFQVGGHIFSSIAISRIHVSTVHTIKVSSVRHPKKELFIEPQLGIVAFIHRCCLCFAFWCQLFDKNLHITLAPDHWCHAGMFLRSIGIKHHWLALCLWLCSRFRELEYILQENHAITYWRDIIVFPQT